MVLYMHAFGPQILRIHFFFLIISYTLQVMCPTCLCTGMAMASEHDPRIDPFD